MQEGLDLCWELCSFPCTPALKLPLQGTGFLWLPSPLARRAPHVSPAPSPLWMGGSWLEAEKLCLQRLRLLTCEQTELLQTPIAPRVQGTGHLVLFF